MPKPPDDKGRIEQAEKAYDALQDLIKVLQASAFASIMDWFTDNIATGKDGIKSTTGNYTRVGGIFAVLRKFGATLRDQVLGKVIEGVDKIVQENETYFGSPGGIQGEARFQALLRIGYNSKTDKILPGGFLDSLFKGADVSQKVARLMNQAIANGMPLDKFRKLFRSEFIGRGMLERHFKTNTFDLFQRVDRAAHLVYADQLKLNYARYTGTLIQTSRPFCIARVAKVFDRQQIADWANLQFDGKPAIYDPFLDCGGYQCRHHLSFISDGLAKQFLKNQG